MVTLLQNQSTIQNSNEVQENTGYTNYQEVDKSVPPKAQPVIGDISVNGQVILESEILAEAQNHPAESPGKALREAAQALVIRELLWQEAKNKGKTGENNSQQSGKVETQRDLAIKELIDSEVQIPTATDEETLRYFKQNRKKFRTDPLYDANHILVAITNSGKNSEKTAEKLAKEICKQLIENEDDFAELAKQYSACPSSKNGGNLGQITPGSTVIEFEKAMEKLQEGETTTTPVKTKFGFHIIRLNKRVPSEQLPFEAVKERIAGWLEASSWSKAISQYIAVLAGAAEIKGFSIKQSDGTLIQ